MEKIIQPHEIQFCCGTSCDAKANFAYVKKLEQHILFLEQELKCANRSNRLLRRNAKQLDDHS